MTGHQYLEQVLSSQVVPTVNITAMQQARAQIEDVLRNAFGWGPRVYYAGSYGKDTMIAAYHDLDIVFYFPFGTNASLKTIYWDVYHALTAAGYILQQKDVAIRIPYSAGFSIDVVPGRAIDATFDYANLYRSETDSWLQTSIKQHIETIRNSNLRETMKLVKLWNVRHGLGVRSFALELLTIRALQGSQVYGHDSKLMAMFAFLRDHMATIRLVDPANTNNIITDAIPHATKKTVVFQAEKALTAQYWSDIVW